MRSNECGAYKAWAPKSQVQSGRLTRGAHVAASTRGSFDPVAQPCAHEIEMDSAVLVRWLISYSISSSPTPMVQAGGRTDGQTVPVRSLPTPWPTKRGSRSTLPQCGPAADCQVGASGAGEEPLH